MKKYLLDTNICIYYLKGLFNLDKKIKSIGLKNCFISEITVAELKFGVENSENKKVNKKVVEEFISSMQKKKPV
jgi:tRNA(fMet)-specific endonuclease VapC